MYRLLMRNMYTLLAKDVTKDKLANAKISGPRGIARRRNLGGGVRACAPYRLCYGACLLILKYPLYIQVRIRHTFGPFPGVYARARVCVYVAFLLLFTITTTFRENNALRAMRANSLSIFFANTSKKKKKKKKKRDAATGKNVRTRRGQGHQGYNTRGLLTRGHTSGAERVPPPLPSDSQGGI